MNRSAIENWLTSLWGIRPGYSSPMCQLTSDHIPTGAADWMQSLWAISEQEVLLPSAAA